MDKDKMKMYWKRNLRYLLILLAIWFGVSYGAGILFADALNNIRIGGFQLGFWFAQQGSIYVFVVLIFVYVWLMNKLDQEFDPASAQVLQGLHQETHKSRLPWIYYAYRYCRNSGLRGLQHLHRRLPSGRIFGCVSYLLLEGT